MCVRIASGHLVRRDSDAGEHFYRVEIKKELATGKFTDKMLADRA
jgi:hypothetical protein